MRSGASSKPRARSCGRRRNRRLPGCRRNNAASSTAHRRNRSRRRPRPGRASQPAANKPEYALRQSGAAQRRNRWVIASLLNPLAPAGDCTTVTPSLPIVRCKCASPPRLGYLTRFATAYGAVSSFPIRFVTPTTARITVSIQDCVTSQLMSRCCLHACLSANLFHKRTPGTAFKAEATLLQICTGEKRFLNILSCIFNVC